MKKRLLCILVLVLMVTLTACGGGGAKGKATNDVTWDELLAANTMDAVFAQTGAFSATIEADDGTYINYAAMVDGKLISANGTPGYTQDLINGIRYNASEEGIGQSITIMAPTADLKEVVEGACGEELAQYQAPSKIYLDEGQYYAEVSYEDEEWGAVTKASAYFDAETLLLDRIDLVQKLGNYETKLDIRMAYGITDFPMVSYDRIVNAEDTVDVTIHYPDGLTKDITVDRKVDVIVYHPSHEEQWSVCGDAACTGSVDDLGWITGSHGDLYLYNGFVESAPPTVSRVLKNSTFESVFKENGNTYSQEFRTTDANHNPLQMIDLTWYEDPEAGLSLIFEVQEDDLVVQSARARDNAWYAWSAESGYAVDFYDAFSYAESLIKDYRLFLYEEQLGAPMMQDGENMPYYIPYAETVKDGMVNEYQYHIHPDTDYIERVEITQKDNAGNIVGYETCYIGGNGPIPGDMDIFAAISAPEDTEAIALTVVTPNGKKTYSVRNDAAISWKGGALYSDANRTTAVTDLTWVDGSEATVYVK